MVDFSTTPIDTVGLDGTWFSTYRYEPFLKKWFFITPNMHESIRLLNTESVPSPVLQAAQPQTYNCKRSYYAPVKIQVQLNKSCNYRCRMCYAYDHEKQTEKLSRKDISKFLNDAKRSGVLRINYVGGEVFMRPDFSDIVDETRANHLLVSCISNGIIPGMAPQRYQHVLDNLFNIQISCNGIGSSYEYEYNTHNWERAAKCIATVIANTPTNILSFVISENNFMDIPQFLEFANQIHPSVVKFGTICWSGNSKGAQTEKYYKTILPKAKEMIDNGRDKYGNLRIQSQLDKGCHTPLWEDYLSSYRPFEFYFSPEGKDGIYLKSSGEYYPFPLLSDHQEFLLGTLDQNILDIWENSSVLAKLRDATFEKTLCGKQGCKDVCGLWSRSYAYSWSGNILGKIPCEFSNWD